MPTEEEPAAGSGSYQVIFSCFGQGNFRTDTQGIEKGSDIFDNFGCMPGGIFAPDCNKFRTNTADIHTGTPLSGF
jgi:hypothetical protein